MTDKMVMDFIVNNMSYLIGALGVLMIIMYLLVINLYYNLNYMKKRYKKMMTGVDGANLERMMIGCIDSIKAINNENEKLWAETKEIKDLLQRAVTRMAIVRFRAFEDMGGDLSYAVAMLDSNNNGVIMSSIFAREDSRSYAKPIVNGQSTYALTKEEEEALQQALQQ
ncbi:MAG: DUF4446 family protein [Selenomonadaceae bacterium]|nr:DUF4446 family protein [Selenomonadaceae bacterium]MDD6397111.1 DUF4446 family protein [Selenomonadaceae bacterium]